MTLSSLHYPMTPKDSFDRFDILEKEPEVVKFLKQLYDMGNVHPSVFSRLVRQKPTTAFKVSRMLKKLNMTGGVKELVRFYGEFSKKGLFEPIMKTSNYTMQWEYGRDRQIRQQENEVRRIRQYLERVYQEGGNVNYFHSLASLDSHSGDVIWGAADLPSHTTGDTVSYNTSTITDLTE